jgi:hypothetical protein
MGAQYTVQHRFHAVRFHPKFGSHVGRHPGRQVQSTVAFPPRQIEHGRHRAIPVDQIALHHLQPDLGSLGFDDLVRYAGAQEGDLTAFGVVLRRLGRRPGFREGLIDRRDRLRAGQALC